MAIEPGSKLGPYEILAPLGAGGMGEVYRARDTKLGREVAIKVLPSQVARDPERLSRFRREATLLAALNHPHVAAIHGLEESDGSPFLVLELVEGEDLAERLRRGPIPVEEALEIARQITEALEEAHDRGIVHRDLKPGNVKLTPDGKAKVLDFGLAKAYAGDAGPDGVSSDFTRSPTLARSDEMTTVGVILGTPQYMSPEQASGKPVGKRADIWAFGVVFLEMLTGERVFAGETASETLASVIKDEPSWDALPDSCPAAVARLIRRCLRKRPRERLHDIGDARLELEEALRGEAEEIGRAGHESGVRLQAGRRGRGRESAAWAALALALGALLALFARRDPALPPESRPVVRFGLDVPEKLPLRDAALAVSPDGRHVALTPWGPGEQRLWIWSLDQPGARPLPGTEGAWLPIWSPDSESIAFFARQRQEVTLRRTDVTAGGIQTICGVPGNALWLTPGGWSEDGRILFGAGNPPGARIRSVSAAGGEPKAVLELDASGEEVGHHWPQLLPDGHRLLFQSFVPRDEAPGIWLSSLNAPHERKPVLPGIMSARYAAPGHLLRVHHGTLLAYPFDVARAEPTGEPSVIASPVAIDSRFPAASTGLFSTSRNGVLAYVEAEQGAPSSELAWFSRDGARLGEVGDPAQYEQIALSPDETRVAAQITDPGGNMDLWTLDLDRGVATRATSDPALDQDVVWSRDGDELFFDSDRGEDVAYRLHRKRLGRSGSESLLLDSPRNAFAESVSPDGTSLVYLTGTGPHDAVWTLPLTGSGEPELVMRVDYGIAEPRISPDGRWLAYGSEETGRWEVYVAPFRREGQKVRVSLDGGRQPRWRGDGGELFYVTPQGLLMAAEARETAGRFEVSLPVTLFHAGVSSHDRDEYGVTSDGQRFLVIVPKTPGVAPSLRVVLNWPSLVD